MHYEQNNLQERHKFILNEMSIFFFQDPIVYFSFFFNVRVLQKSLTR